MPTDEEYDKFRRAVIKKLKFLESQIGDIWEKLGTNDSEYRELTDEAIDRAARAERAVRRVKKAFEDHDHEEEDE
jgi:predicted transcriptional regulator